MPFAARSSRRKGALGTNAQPLMVQEPEEAASERQQIVYIPDFFEELKAKMAEAGQ